MLPARKHDSFAGHYLVSAGLGVLACAAALTLPVHLSFLSPMCVGLMGPTHWMYGTQRERQRKTFEQELLRESAVTA